MKILHGLLTTLNAASDSYKLGEKGKHDRCYILSKNYFVLLLPVREKLITPSNWYLDNALYSNILS